MSEDTLQPLPPDTTGDSKPASPPAPIPTSASTPPHASSQSHNPNPTNPDSYTKPQPRPPKSPAHAAQVRIQNRRREWLARHGATYLRRLDHELADPVRYDRLIRRFQSPAQREAEGRAKGFGRVLEVDLLRGEARMARLGREIEGRDADGTWLVKNGGRACGQTGVGTEEVDDDEEEEEAVDLVDAEDDGESGGAGAGGDGYKEGRSEGEGKPPQTAEEGRERWDAFLRRRFVAGGDEEFDYRAVDEDDEFDALERREQEDAWFDNEEPEWAGDGDGEGEGDDEKKGIKGSGERTLIGETGVQDF
ncbi:hypothetical protein F5Y16DRAFT_161984 [Xylariaceae sp. FL0255]|nr:hypothetical protein F5Y16DRAFT_161984 [Xylariaceae sp. FL0255]